MYQRRRFVSLFLANANNLKESITAIIASAEGNVSV
jgi:hypothetical protein